MNALLEWVSLRHLARDGLRSALTVLGVALGVAVFVSIRLANHAALGSFGQSVDAVAGRANVQVAGDTDGFDERLFRVVRDTPGVVAAAPIVETRARARAGGAARVEDGAERRGYPETVVVLGVDVFSEAPFARAGGAGPGLAAALELLRERAAALPARYAQRLGLGVGDSLTLLSEGRAVTLRVARVLPAGVLDQAWDGAVVVVDLATAQEHFHHLGRLDRVECLVREGDEPRVTAALARRLPPGLRVEPPAARSRQVGNMVRAFSLNLAALSLIALFVSTFLIFHAVSMAVVHRRAEIALGRALGVTRGATLLQFLIEGLLLGGVGALLGLGLGTAFARLTLGAVARTLTDLYLVQAASVLPRDPASYAMGFAIGVASALAAALLPALDAARTPPVTEMREGGRIEVRRLPLGAWGVGGVAMLVAALGAAVLARAASVPIAGFVSAFLVLVGFTLLAPGWTALVSRLAVPAFGRALGIEAALGARALGETPARTGVLVAALMVAVGMVVALAVMVGSFRVTVDTWVRQTIRGDLYVDLAGHRVNHSAVAMPPDFVARVRALPGVAAVDSYRGTRVTLDDRPAFVAGVDFAVQRDHGHLALVHGDARERLGRALATGGVLVSESFARHHHARDGGTLVLPTPSGIARLPIAGVFYDYSTDAGAVFMDLAQYAKWWRDPRTESLALYLAPGADAANVRRQVLAAAGPDLMIDATPNRVLRERVLSVFDQTFQVTWGLEVIAVLVAVLGVIGALTARVLERRREIGVLRGIGALSAQVRRIVLVEAGLIGFAGAALGCVAGFALALLLIEVINRMYFGWTIRLHVDPWVFARTLGLVVVTALIAGWGPADAAARRPAALAMREE